MGAAVPYAMPFLKNLHIDAKPPDKDAAGPCLNPGSRARTSFAHDRCRWSRMASWDMSGGILEDHACGLTGTGFSSSPVHRVFSTTRSGRSRWSLATPRSFLGTIAGISRFRVPRMHHEVDSGDNAAEHRRLDVDRNGSTICRPWGGIQPKETRCRTISSVSSHSCISFQIGSVREVRLSRFDERRSSGSTFCPQ